jgi:hypothetical protein
MTPADELEATLCRAYRREAELYARAVAAAGGHDAVTDWLAAANDVLVEVAAVEAEIAATKAAWNRRGGRPGPELAAALNDVADQIQRLVALVDASRGELEERRRRMLPVLDGSIRQRRMRAAYDSAADGRRGDRP